MMIDATLMMIDATSMMIDGTLTMIDAASMMIDATSMFFLAASLIIYNHPEVYSRRSLIQPTIYGRGASVFGLIIDNRMSNGNSCNCFSWDLNISLSFTFNDFFIPSFNFSNEISSYPRALDGQKQSSHQIQNLQLSNSNLNLISQLLDINL